MDLLKGACVRKNQFHGGAIGNHINGNNLSNRLYGHGGDDIIAGRAGRDMLNGGRGNDVPTGGKGADTVVFDIGEKHSSETITDLHFGQGDVIDLPGIDANGATKSDEAFKLIGSDEFAGRAGQLRVEEKDGDTILTGDWRGDGKADFSIVVDGGFKFADSNVIL